MVFEKVNHNEFVNDHFPESFKVVVPKIGSSDQQQQQQHLGTCSKSNILGPTFDLLSQNRCLTRYVEDSDIL